MIYSNPEMGQFTVDWLSRQMDRVREDCNQELLWYGPKYMQQHVKQGWWEIRSAYINYSCPQVPTA